MAVIEMRADELIPGDRFDTRCGAGLDAFCKITKVRLIEVGTAGSQDRIEIRYESDCISPTRTLLASSMVRILAV
jgi:hypothetical protein